MTPQNVIKSFITRLASHGYTAGNEIAMLDSAVRASSRFTSIDEVIASMQADHLSIQSASIQTVITTIFGEERFETYCLNADGSVKSLEDISSDLLYYNYNGFTVKELIEETTALAFLREGCGIILDNDDTGAITGSDANITFTADMFGENGEQTLRVFSEYYGNEGSLSADGKTFILGTGVTKTADDVVPENFNTYTASNNAVQNINTGSKNWVVNATNKNDTITSNGADYISSGAGDDVITANADGATISTGTGKDKLTVSASVKNIKITDLSNNDELTILGTFEVGSATVEDMTLVITDKTGTRKLTLAQFQANTKVNVGDASLTLGDWLADKADWDWSTATESAETSSSSSSTLNVNLDEISADSSGTVKVNNFVAGKLSNSYPNLDTFTVNGLTIHLRGRASDIALTEVVPLTFNDLDDNQKTVLAGLFKWWVKESLNLNEESFGVTFGDNATVHDIDLYFFYDNESSLAAILPSNRKDYDGITTALFLNVNLAPYQTVTTDNVNGKDDTGGYLDRTLAHEFNHAVLSANVNYFTNLPTFLKEGFAELTHGIDDEREEEIRYLAKDPASLAEQLDLSNLPETTHETYSAGYIFLRYFAKQAATQTLFLPTFGEIKPVDVNFNALNVNAGNIIYVDTSDFNATIKVARNSSAFEKLDDPYNSLFELGTIYDLDGKGTLYYSIDNDLVRQNITLGGKITNVYQLNANTNLTGSSGADAIQVFEGKNSINGGNGDDYLEVTGQYSTIDTGEGNDQVIAFDGSHNKFNLGNGDNYLEFSGEPFSADGYIYSFLYDNSITAGNGNDSITNPDVRYFDADGYEVTADTAGATSLPFYGYHFNYNIDLGDGDNQLAFTALINSSVRTGKDNDNVFFTVLRDSTVNTGDGNDVISFGSSGNIIDAGEGMNIIYFVGGSSNTIKASAGINYISISPAVESFTVEDFGEDDGILLESEPEIFEIADGKLVVDNATITGISAIATDDYSYKSDANHLSLIEEFSPGAILNIDEITYSTSSGSDTLFTITGLNSSVGVEVDGFDVILTDTALANRTANKITISEGYNLKIDGAEDGVLTLTEAEDETFEDGTYTAAITAETFTEEEDGSIIYNKATGGQQFKITGIKDNAELDEDILIGEDGKVTIKSSALPEEISEGTAVALTDLKSGDGVNYSLTFDEEIDQDDSTHKGGWSGENGTFTFTEDYKLAHWKKNSNTYTFHEQSGGHEFKLSGMDSTLTADKFTSKTISVKKDATTGYTFKILSSDILPKTGTVSIAGVKGINDIAAADCALALDSKVAAPKDIVESLKAKSGKYTYTATGTSAGWSLVDGKIVYSAQVGGDQFELSGIKSGVKLNSGLTVSGSVAKVFSNALNTSEKDGVKIVLTDDAKKYSLQLDSEILQAANEIPGAFTDIKSGKATYTATHTLSYYEPTAENTFTYRKQDAAKKITISNLKKTATLADLKDITIAENSGNKFAITFNDDKVLDAKAPSISIDKGATYTVEVADKLQPAVQSPNWFVKSTNASLKADTSAGYTVKNNKVVYSKVQTGKPQVILAGIEKNSSFDVPAGDTLTLKSASLGAKSSIKSNAEDFTVNLTGDMKGKKFFGTNGDDTLVIAASNAYVEGGKGNDNFTVTGQYVTLVGGKGNDNFTVSNSAVLAYSKGDGLDTVNYAAGLQISLNGSMKPTSVAQNNTNLIINLGKGDSITVTDMGDTLKTVNKTDSLIIEKSKLNLGEKLTFNSGSTSVTIGSSFTGTITPDDDIYLSKGKLSSVSTINASNVSGEVLIVGNGKANTIIGGKNSTLEGGKGDDVFVYSGGKLTIADYGNGTDKISLGTAYESYSVKNDDVIISFGNSNSMTIKDSAGKPITLVEGKNSTTNVYSADGTFNSGQTSVIVSGSTFDATSYSKLVTISAADSSQNVKIVGNAKNNVIIGGAGNDTLTGDKGKDTFVYDGKGADVITDYAAEDKISLKAGLSLSDVAVKGQDATLSFSEGGTLKLAGVGDKKVTVVESSIDSKGKITSKSNTYIFEDKKIFNAAQTAVSVTGNSFNAGSYSKLITISAATDNGVKIDGNAKNNVIIGGAGNDSLWGGTGNDTLTGGKGADVFIYKPNEGKDTITDYESGELLSILNGTFKDAVFNKNTLTLNIDGGGSVIFKNVTTSTEFNINGTIHKVNGKTLT